MLSLRWAQDPLASLEQGRGIGPLPLSLPAVGTMRSYADMSPMAAEISAARMRSSVAAARGDLSSRELDVLRTAVQWLTTQEIAGTFFVSPNTLKSHMKSIYRKLDLTSRTDACTLARPAGCSSRAARCEVSPC
ncbi:MAG: response regulator transcription factor [Streptosporangiaceae bacterium]